MFDDIRFDRVFLVAVILLVAFYATLTLFSSPARAADSSGDRLVRIGPDKYGVVCYNYSSDPRNLSCVQVQEPTR